MPSADFFDFSVKNTKQSWEVFFSIYIIRFRHHNRMHPFTEWVHLFI